MQTFEFTTADHAAVRSASKILLARYRNFVEYEDVQQELYLWLFQNYEKAEIWRETYEERHAERVVTKALRNAGERYCRAEKSHKDGYSTDDEFFYSIPMCSDLLMLYFDPEWMIPNGIELTTTSSGKPASEGGNLMTMVADIGKAYESMPDHDRELLRRIYRDPKHVDDEKALLALELGITHKAADSRVRRVMGRLRARLGGASPYREDRA